MQNRIQTLVKS